MSQCQLRFLENLTSLKSSAHNKSIPDQPLTKIILNRRRVPSYFLAGNSLKGIQRIIRWGMGAKPHKTVYEGHVYPKPLTVDSLCIFAAPAAKILWL